MKTGVNTILVRDDLGIEKRIRCRCPNGDFKRKFVMRLINEGALLPTEDVVALLGEVLAENQRMIRRLKKIEDDFDVSSTFADDQCETINTARKLVEVLQEVLNGEADVDIERDED